MKRYFFDVASPSHVRFDYQGRDFANSEEAQNLAELMALDLATSEDCQSSDLEIQVRTIAGTKIYSVPVGVLEAEAA
jgi:hypothetical protein